MTKRNYKYRKTLKFRINLIAIMFSLLLFIITSSILITTYSKLAIEQIKEENINFMNNVKNELEKNIESMDNISKQFLPIGSLGLNIIELYHLENAGNKSIVLTNVKNDISLMEFANPDIELISLMLDDGIIENISSYIDLDEIDYENEPKIYSSYNADFYGPHISNKTNVDNYVLSMKRDIDLGLGVDTYVYVETDIERVIELIEDRANNGFYYEIYNGENILYTTYENIEKNDFYSNSISSDDGWKIVSYIDTSVMNRLSSEIFLENIYIYPLIIFVGIIFSIIIMKFISKPLNVLNDGIKQIENGDFNTIIPKTNVYEFDTIINRLHNAKLQISILMDDIREKEKELIFGEISRLRVQINPHFLLNTLNTLKWMSKDKNLSSSIVLLNKILSYNMSYDYVTTLGDEIDNIKKYIEIQQLKYNVILDIENCLGDDIYIIEMPKFILQPIIENSILHGNGNDIKIFINIDIIDEGLEILIKDNGATTSKEKIDFINENRENPKNLGIGLAFVFTTVKNYYNKNDLISYFWTENGIEVKMTLPFGDD